MLGDCTDHRACYARGLVDQFAYSTTWGLYRPPSTLCSGTGRPVRLFDNLGTVPTTEHDMLGDWPTSSPDQIDRFHLVANKCIASNWIILTILTLLQGSYYAFQQARGLHRYDASGDASSHQILYENFFFFDPGTTCLRHLLPGSGTKWAHFTLR